MYLGWRFLLLIGVDRDGQNSGTCGHPVDSRTGCHLCSDSSHQSHRHSPVTPLECPCWYRKRKIPLEQTDAAASVWLATFYLVFAVPEWTELGQCVFKVGQSSGYTQMKYFLLGCQKRKMHLGLWSLQSQNWHVSAGAPLDLWRTYFHDFVSETGYKIAAQIPT